MLRNDLQTDPKHFEHRIQRYGSASIPEGPADPFVRKAAFMTLISSIESKTYS